MHNFLCPGHPNLVGILNVNCCVYPDRSNKPRMLVCSHEMVGTCIFHCRDDGGGEDGMDMTIIFASRVGNGVIDCPDGLDERATVTGMPR